MDISDTGLEVVLAQNNKEEKKRIIAYEAKKLSILERNYLTTKKKCLAVI